MVPASSEQIDQFINEDVDVYEGNTGGKELYESYESFCERNSYAKFCNRIFSQEMVERGFTKTERACRKVFYNCGLKSKPISVEEEPITDPETKVSYIYLIREREFLKRGEPIYKVGRTTQQPDSRIARFDAYKKGSELILLVQCRNDKVVAIETEIKHMFKIVFKSNSDGTEYFDGEPDKMSDIIYEIAKRNR